MISARFRFPSSKALSILPLYLIGGGGLMNTLPSHAEGFQEDAKASLNLRNFYFNRNYVDSQHPQNQSEAWTQSFILDARSGFTRGTVGFGIDVLGSYSQKLDAGRGAGGTQLLPIHDNAEPAENFGRLGVAAKARIMNTEIKVGEWMPVLPILRADDGRSLPQTLRGGQLTSTDIDGIKLYGGQFRGNRERNDASIEDLSMSGRAGLSSDRFNFAGSEYTFNNKNTLVGAWAAQLQDIYAQQYLQLVHTQPLGDWVVRANLGYFHGSDDGKAIAGSMENRTYSAALSAKYGGHTLYLGLQKLTGETGWMRISGTSGGSLATDTFNSSYDNAQERSWQVRYDYDFAALGVPGLTLMNRYTSGTNVHIGTITDGRERGRETELGYTVQSGTLKNLNIRWRNLMMRRDYNTNQFDDNRLIISYPLSIL